MYKKSSVKVSYNKKGEFYNNRINFNFDYFKPFDQNSFIEMQQNKSIILPYYTRAEFYRQNLFGKYNNLRNKKKIFQILFSGSNHPDWYEQFKWQTSYKDKNPILSRCAILDFVKKEFKNEIQIIGERSQISTIDSKKKILFFISDPSKKRRLSKILSMDEHIEFIASSNFFQLVSFQLSVWMMPQAHILQWVAAQQF